MVVRRLVSAKSVRILFRQLGHGGGSWYTAGMLQVSFVKLHSQASVPEAMTAGAAGIDLSACLEEPTSIEPGRRALIPTGMALSLPGGYEGQIRPRSGLALKHGVTVLNAPGTIDSDYRGEVKVLLVNFGDRAFDVKHGDRIAQLVVAKVEQVVLVQVDDLDSTARSSGGFGSTGI